MADIVKKLAGATIGNFLTFSTLESADVVVDMVCKILGLVITIVSLVVVPVAKKIINAKKDGKITLDEAEDIINTVSEGAEKLKDTVNKDE